MRDMKTRLSLFAAAVGAVTIGLGALAPGLASAQMVELGQTATTPLVAPSCVKGKPLATCKIVLTRTTAIESLSDGIINPTRVNQEGYIVSFTVGLSQLVLQPQDAGGADPPVRTPSTVGLPSLRSRSSRPVRATRSQSSVRAPVYTLTPFPRPACCRSRSRSRPTFSSFTTRSRSSAVT